MRGQAWYQHTVAIDVDDGASPSLVFSLVFLLLLMKAIFHQHDLVCFLFSESVILVVVVVIIEIRSNHIRCMCVT